MGNPPHNSVMTAVSVFDLGHYRNYAHKIRCIGLDELLVLLFAVSESVCRADRPDDLFPTSAAQLVKLTEALNPYPGCGLGPSQDPRPVSSTSEVN